MANSFITRNKRLLLWLRRRVNTWFCVDLARFPDDALVRRIQLMKTHGIDVILDVGANIGQYGSEMRALGFSGKIYSFEPTSTAFAALEKVARNDPDWEVFHCALGETESTLTMHLAQNSVSSSLLVPKKELFENAPEARTVGQETVSVSTLDNMFQKLGLQGKSIYLKIDTQGYEKVVLAGAQKILPQITGVQLELALITSYEQATEFREGIAMLEAGGFELCTIEPGFFDRKTGRLYEADGVFYRPDTNSSSRDSN